MKRKNMIWVVAVLVPSAAIAATIAIGVDRVRSGDDAPATAQRWGIEIAGVRRAAAGFAIDFEYRVVDPDRAAPLFQRTSQPYLIDQRNGMRLTVSNSAKIGALRSRGTSKNGNRQFIIFANNGQQVVAGDQVTVVVGDFRVENLTVE